MKCPLQSKCQSQLVGLVKESADRVLEIADEAQQTIAILEEELALKNFHLEAMKKSAVENITEKGKKQISGYRYIYGEKLRYPCGKCEQVETRLNANDMAMTFCHKFDHRADKRHGTCPNHSALKGKPWVLV